MSDTPMPEPTPSTNASSGATPPPMPDPFAPASGASPQMSAAEVSDGKLLAILSYILPIVAIVVVIIRNNNFALYHAKQVLVPLILFAVLAVAATILGILPITWCLTLPTLLLALVCFVILMIMGVINVLSDKTVPLPLIGYLADRWFSGVQKLPTP